MKRRDFVKGLASMPLAFNNVGFGQSERALMSALASNPSERVLVLIQLNGGNDGLNTLVPLDQFSALMNVRSNVMLPQNKLLSLNDKLALHPALQGIKSIWDEGKVSFVQDVGYPNQNRSHFRSLDIYNTASPADEVFQTGWMGRHFEDLLPGFPIGYPNGENPDPIAVTLGASVSETCQGVAGNFALTTTDPLNLRSVIDIDGEANPNSPRYSEELEFLQQNFSQANEYGLAVNTAALAGQSLVTYPDNEFATQLSYVARMISGGLSSKLYVITLGGFDTHAGQVDDSDPTLGAHANLLSTLADGIQAFQQDINALGLEDRVLGMTYSEFGRRIMSNAALGTDHGTAAPAILFGNCVIGGVIGENPTIPNQVDIFEGVPMQHDFRDIYGTVLQDWFGLDEIKVRQLVYSGYNRLNLLRNCGAPSSVNEPALDSALLLSPNPFAESTCLEFSLTIKSRVSASVHSSTGGLVEELFSNRLSAGHHRIAINTSSYVAGVYHFRVQAGSSVRVVRGVRV